MNKYDDIINLEHHTSKKRPRMSLSDRAAQFAPFAALVGYDDAVEETARHTDEQTEIHEELVASLDMSLRRLAEHQKENPCVCITYFLHDEKKSGGKYVTVSGNVKRIDEISKQIILTDGKTIPFSDIVGVDILS